MENDRENLNLLHKALAVGEIPENFDPNKIPETGEEYLHHVMYESMQCEEYVRAEIAKDKLNNKTLQVEVRKGCEEAPKSILPSIEWQNAKISEFSTFRMHLARIRYSSPDRTTLFNGSERSCRELCSKPPITSDVLFYNQHAITTLLDFHIEWLNEIEEGTSLPHLSGTWLYAILSRLEIPLWPEICFKLRELARKCSIIRAALPENAAKEQYTSLNLFICLVARYFNQNDLADN